MSLINRMLQDLAARAPQGGALLADVQVAAPPTPRAAVRTVALAGLVLLTVTLAAGAWLVPGPPAPPATAEATPARLPAQLEPPPPLARFQLALALARLPDGPPRRRARAASPPAAADPPAAVAPAELAAVETVAMPLAEPALPLPLATPAERRQQARAALARRDAAAAQALLEPDAPPVAADPEYHGLLASAYQRLDRHNDAVRIYESLLRVQPEQAHWWAALGLSRDALGQRDDALRAYARARALGRLEPRVLEHIDRRAAALRAG